MYKEGVAEALSRISKIRSRNDKIATLRSDHSMAMENIVDICFNPDIKFDFELLVIHE